MIALFLVVIWIASNLLCLYITRKRNVKVGLFLQFIAICLGPFAIPIACLCGESKALSTSI